MVGSPGRGLRKPLISLIRRAVLESAPACHLLLPSRWPEFLVESVILAQLAGITTCPLELMTVGKLRMAQSYHKVRRSSSILLSHLAHHTPPIDQRPFCSYNPSRVIKELNDDEYRLYPRMRRALEDIVSLTPIGEPRHKITTASIREKKLHRDPITCLTAYDYAAARLVDEAGIDVVLVGDSLAMTMLGYENTLSVTMDEMLHHVRAVRRGVKDALLIADMPYGSYHLNAEEAIRNAARFVKEGGAEAVKMEGGENRVDVIRRVIDAEIPLPGTLG